jgi:hypothetical protein
LREADVAGVDWRQNMQLMAASVDEVAVLVPGLALRAAIKSPNTVTAYTYATIHPARPSSTPSSASPCMPLAVDKIAREYVERFPV